MKINLSIIFEERNIKNFTIFHFVFSIQHYSQSYLNIHYTDDSYKYAPLSSIQKITFNAGGDQLIVLLTDKSSTADDCSTIGEITYDNDPLGNPLPVEMEITIFKYLQIKSCFLIIINNGLLHFKSVVKYVVVFNSSVKK